jgi:hypothetical protein
VPITVPNKITRRLLFLKAVEEELKDIATYAFRLTYR